MIIDTHAHIGTLPPFDMTIEHTQSRRISSCAKR